MVPKTTKIDSTANRIYDFAVCELLVKNKTTFMPSALFCVCTCEGMHVLACVCMSVYSWGTGQDLGGYVKAKI